jgi:hypothetical protein
MSKVYYLTNKLIKFIKNGFSTNIGYTVLERIYYYKGKAHLGYILVKNYNICWIPGYERIAICSSKKELDETLEKLKIKLR